MQGFEDRFKDFPDYIIQITRDIWEGRGVARLEDWYASDLIFRMASGIGVGRADVVRGTLATLHEFPDRELLPEDVIWSGSPETGMLSSHRSFCTAHYMNDGQFGPAANQPVTFRAIADCHAKNNQIDDEWLARDQGAICRQLGTTPEDFARGAIAAEGGFETAKRAFTPDQDIAGPYQGRGNTHETGARYADILKSLMNADVAVVQRAYDRACRLSYPSGVEARGHAPAEQFWIGLRSALPDAQFSIEHQIGMDGSDLSPRSAIRFSLKGKHDGLGMFGQPTGAEVYVMGFAHAYFGPWGLREEIVVFDETAIWKQILMHKG